MRRSSRPLLVAIAVALAACTSVTGPDADTLTAAIQRWQASGLVSYQFRRTTSCYCPADFVRPVTITVRAGQVVAVADRATGEPRELSRGASIDSLFRMVATEIRDRPERLQVTYDAQLGFPRTLTYGTPENDGGGYITADSVVAIR
jgi:hypothetical protein